MSGDDIADYEVAFLEHLFERSRTRFFVAPGYGSLRVTDAGDRLDCTYWFEMENVDFGRLNRYAPTERSVALADGLNELGTFAFYPAATEFRAEGGALLYTLPPLASPAQVGLETVQWYADTAAEHFDLSDVRRETMLDPYRYLQDDEGALFFTGPDLFPAHALRRMTLDELLDYCATQPTRAERRVEEVLEALRYSNPGDDEYW